MRDRRPGLLILMGVLCVLFAAQAPAFAQTSTSGVVPQFIAGNPSCADLEFTLGTKPQPEPPPTGSYPFPLDPVHGFDISSDGIYFSWTSNLGIDAVIVKGGPNANVYRYAPEAFADSGLASPINSSNGQPYAISHIEVCYDYEVDVAKTAETSFTRTYTWDIAKGVSPASWELFVGDTATSTYAVTVSKTVTDSDWAVVGDITIANNTPFDATITSVADVISDGIEPVVDCGGAQFPYVLTAGMVLECSYRGLLPDGSTRVNTATVATSGAVGGGSATAGVDFGAPTTEVGYPSVSVSDTNGQRWSFDDSGTETYTGMFDCSQNTYGNTATIDETQQSASASVTVQCHELEVAKTAETSCERTYEWGMAKVATDLYGEVSELVLSTGQEYPVTYEVQAYLNGTTDSAHAVSGTVTVSNPTTMNATLTGMTDALGGLSIPLSCGVSFPHVLAGGGSLTCDYSADLPDGSGGTNTATAFLQNYDYGPTGVEPGFTTPFSGSAEVSFKNPLLVEQYDECIEVSDTSFTEPLGTVCFGVDSLPASFTYEASIGPFESPDDCGQLAITNTASCLSNDNGLSGEVTWTIDVTVPCDQGCTLTPGYWKTHSIYGPAPYDGTWAAVGEDTPFFWAEGPDSVIASWIEVLWTPPQGGNAYYILAHAHIAAVLNGFNGASMPGEIGAAMADAEAWFADPGHTPEYAADLKGKRGMEERSELLRMASLLDDYNNGTYGPGHCSE